MYYRKYKIETVEREDGWYADIISPSGEESGEVGPVETKQKAITMSKREIDKEMRQVQTSNLIRAFQEDADKLGRDKNSMEELGLWLHAHTKQAEGDWEFISELTSESVDVWSTEPGVSFSGMTAVIKWRLDLEVRSYGIKDFNAIIDKVHLVGTKEFTEEDREEDFDFNVPSDWDVEVTGGEGNYYYPTSIEVRLDQKKVEVLF